MYNVTSISPLDGRPTGGSSLVIKRGIPHEPIQLNTNMQAVAARITFHRTISVCSIYIQPKYKPNIQELDNLINQLPPPIILLGDFNAHNVLWGSQHTNTSGTLIEKFMADHDLCLLNDGSNTYLHPGYGTFSAIDLTICSPTIFMDLKWEVYEDQCGSDHYPIFANIIQPTPPERNSQWRLHKADWPQYQIKCMMDITKQKFQDLEDPAYTFTDTIIEIAKQTIPKSSTNSHRIHKPWFNEDCANAIKLRKQALHKFTIEPSTVNLTNYKAARANARRVIKESKRNSWKQYVSKLNSNTSIKKTWDMVRKISGKQCTSTTKHLTKPDGTKATEREDIANTLAEEFQKNSSTQNYSPKFQKYKNNREKRNLKFNSHNEENYNIPFNMTELKESLDKAHDTATGPDEIHYQLIKHLPESSLEVLLDIYNHIWETGNFPDLWREATIIPIPKAGKDTTIPTNYRPISLTSCLCKTMERMINTRLVWFLEKNNIITRNQSGFRHGRSTIDQLTRLETKIRDAFINKQHMVTVFFDLEKAYDTTWKHGIMEDLHNMGLRGRMPSFIQNFLSGRNFKVRLGTTLSESQDQEMGVPQGSILSVTLFSIKINSIIKVVKSEIDNPYL